MIVTAAFLLGVHYEVAHTEKTEVNGGELLVLVFFLWFDYECIKLLAGGL